jgi:hypothetical protein
MKKLALLALSSLMFVACGPPKAGDKCNTTGFLCQDTTTAMECKVGLWSALPCKGVGGCKREAEIIKCDMAGNDENDACSSTAEGKGLCTKDGLGTLECRDGKLLKTNTCRSCTVSGETVVCQP